MKAAWLALLAAGSAVAADPATFDYQLQARALAPGVYVV